MYRLIILIIPVLLFGCSNEISLPDQLGRDVEQYYDSEKNEDWAALYQYRRKEFKNTVPLEAFKREMVKYSSGFSLLSYEIIDAKITDNSAFITADFTIQADLDESSVYAPAFKNKLSRKYTEKGIQSHWIKIGEKWQLLDSNRLFQPMSVRIVHDS